MTEDAGRVCDVLVSWTITMIAKNGNSFLETMNLIASQRLTRSVVSSSKMAHESIDAHVAKLLERRDKFVQLIKTNSQPAHSCIDFDMNIGDYSSIQSRVIQRLDHVEPVNHRR